MILAHCDYCNATFRSKAVNFSGRVALKGNSETCPACGGVAKIADGVFSIADGMVEVLSAPEITRQMYASFLGLAKKAKSGEIDDNAFVQAAAAIDPRLEKVAKLATKHKGLAFIALLVIWLHSCVSLDVKLDANKALDQLFGQPGVEYVLPDDEVPANNERNGSEKGSSQPPRGKPFMVMNDQALRNSTSSLAIVSWFQKDFLR